MIAEQVWSDQKGEAHLAKENTGRPEGGRIEIENERGTQKKSPTGIIIQFHNESQRTERKAQCVDLLLLDHNDGDRQLWHRQWIPNPFNWCHYTMCQKFFYVH